MLGTMDHLKSLKTVNFVLGAYTFVLGLLFLLLWVIPGLWAWWDGENAGLLAAAIGVLCFLLIGGIGIAHVVVGYLVGSGRGRVAQTFLATTQLMSFPVGTAYALYALWVCWSHEPSRQRFEAAIKPPVS
jgi:hypothetical protein